MTELQRLFRRAERNGVSRYEIGHYLFTSVGHIYELKNPTSKTIEKIKEAIKVLTKQKKKSIIEEKEA